MQKWDLVDLGRRETGTQTQAGAEAQQCTPAAGEDQGGEQVWSVDFMTAAFSSGRKFRTLNIVDDYTREALAIEVDTSLGGGRVVRVLEEPKARRGLPRQIRSDNGPEFVSRTVDQWTV